jgi:hypothetical protein
MSDELFNFIFGFLVATLLFWFLPLMWRRVIPANIKRVLPFGKKGGEEEADDGEPDMAVEEEVEEIKPKRQGNYKGRPKGSKNIKTGASPAGGQKKRKEIVGDFVVPERSQEQIDLLEGK